MSFKRRYPYKGLSASPYIPETARKVSSDPAGNEVILYVDVADSPTIKYGDSCNWSLDAMLKAGIDPASFHVSTCAPTVVESSVGFDSFATEADSILNDSNS